MKKCVAFRAGGGGGGVREDSASPGVKLDFYVSAAEAPRGSVILCKDEPETFCGCKGTELSPAIPLTT